MNRSFVALAFSLLLACTNDKQVGEEKAVGEARQMSDRTRAILDSLKAGILSTSPWSDVQVEYSADSLVSGWQRSFRCRTANTVSGFEVTFLFPESGEHGLAKRIVKSHGSPFRMTTVDNELFNERDTMDINIYYSELDPTSDFLRPTSDRSYLLILSTPMNWVGRMVSEWRFVQLISFEEECVYELAIPA